MYIYLVNTKEISLEEGIRSVYSLPEADMKKLVSCFHKRELHERYVIVKKGEVSDQLYFLSKGCARSYYTSNEKDVTLWLGHEGDFLTSFKSWISRDPSHETIELNEKGILYQISYADMMKLCEESHSISTFYRLIIEDGLVYWENRTTMLLFKSAKERLQNLTDRYPLVMQRWQLSYVASYLGITQETLSRLRSEK